MWYVGLSPNLGVGLQTVLYVGHSKEFSVWTFDRQCVVILVIGYEAIRVCIVDLCYRTSTVDGTVLLSFTSVR